MTTEIQTEANRRNALQSTGPKTGEGIEAARFNALRHGLRALQTVVPGEAPEEWEAHRIGVVEDLKPEGAVELALAEQLAVKLWRLGRVVRHEADVTAIGQDPEVPAHDHEVSTKRGSMSHPGGAQCRGLSRGSVVGAQCQTLFLVSRPIRAMISL